MTPSYGYALFVLIPTMKVSQSQIAITQKAKTRRPIEARNCMDNCSKEICRHLNSLPICIAFCSSEREEKEIQLLNSFYGSD